MSYEVYIIYYPELKGYPKEYEPNFRGYADKTNRSNAYGFDTEEKAKDFAEFIIKVQGQSYSDYLIEKVSSDTVWGYINSEGKHVINYNPKK
jgi:hypothetical protein